MAAPSPLTAQLLHTGADSLEIVNSSGVSHVSSPLRPVERLVRARFWDRALVRLQTLKFAASCGESGIRCALRCACVDRITFERRRPRALCGLQSREDKLMECTYWLVSRALPGTDCGPVHRTAPRAAYYPDRTKGDGVISGSWFFAPSSGPARPNRLSGIQEPPSKDADAEQIRAKDRQAARFGHRHHCRLAWCIRRPAADK